MLVLSDAHIWYISLTVLIRIQWTLIFSLGVSALLSLMASVVPAAFTEVLATGSGGANDAEVHIEKAMSDVY